MTNYIKNFLNYFITNSLEISYLLLISNFILSVKLKIFEHLRLFYSLFYF